MVIVVRAIIIPILLTQQISKKYIIFNYKLIVTTLKKQKNPIISMIKIIIMITNSIGLPV